MNCGILIYDLIMKVICNLIKGRFLLFIVIATFFSVLFNTGCSKLDKNGNSFGTAVLTFKIEGLKDANSVLNAKASLRSSNIKRLNLEDNLYKETMTNDDYSFDVRTEQNNITSVYEGKKLSNDDKLSKLANTTTSLMGQDIHYRLIVLTLSDDLVASVDVKVGQVQHISVTPGQSYKWVAYSFNSTTPIPNVDMNNPIIETPTTKALLYASDDNTGPITSDGHVIPIVFNHQLTQLEVRVGVTEADPFRTLTEVTGEFVGNAVKKCNFNVVTGQKTSALTPVDVGLMSFSQLNVGSNKVLVSNNYYTADDSYTTYSVKINSLKLQNTATQERDLTTLLPTPSGGIQGQVNFKGFTSSNKGNILIGILEITVNETIPVMQVLGVANIDFTGYGIKLESGTASGNFLRSAYNFGPSSNYVKINSLNVSSLSSAENSGNNYQSYIATSVLNNPTNYPDILVISNGSGLLNASSWEAVRRYLLAGGNVFYTQDVYDEDAKNFLTNILGEPVEITFISETSGVYKFIDTNEGAADLDILNGPFGDARPYLWGQDGGGSAYVHSASGNPLSNIIAYSTHSQNYPNPGPNKTNFFRHKSLSFFYVADGSYLANNNLTTEGPTGPAKFTGVPFRINGGAGLDAYFPKISNYGLAAQSNSPSALAGLHSSDGSYQIANSMIFGNIISWMLRRAQFYPVNRTN